MSFLKKREYSLGLLAIVAIIFALQYYVKGVPALDSFTSIIGNWSVIFSAIAMGMGMLNLSMIHVRNITKRQKEWYLNAWLLFVMWITFALGAYGGITFGPFSWIFNTVFQSLSPTLASFAYLYMCSVAVLSFRIRNWDAALLMLGGVLTMIGNIPMIETYTGAFISIKDWIFAYPARGVFTALRMSMALGLILIGIRTIIGIERGWLGAMKEED